MQKKIVAEAARKKRAAAAITVALTMASVSIAATPAPRTVAPDTSSCPQSLQPPAPVDTSEVPKPGQTSPAPLPIPQVRTGGPLLQRACGVVAIPGFEVPQEQTASAWIVFDLDNGDIIATKDPHGRYRPASIIKVLLAMVALDELDLNQRVQVSQESANQEGSAVGIVPEETYTVSDLVHGLLMASGNDAAHALAQLLGGDAATLEKINALAVQLGTQDTRAASYSGLDGPGMSTSPFDMALMYRTAWANPTFARIVDTDHIDFPGGFQVWNDNGLLMNYPDSIGGKTGYTDDAKHTFVGALDRDGRRLAAVVMDTTIDKGRAWEQAGRLLDASYAALASSAPNATTSIGTVEALAENAPADAHTNAHPNNLADTSPQPGSTPSASDHSAMLIPILLSVLVVAATALFALVTRRRHH